MSWSQKPKIPYTKRKMSKKSKEIDLNNFVNIPTQYVIGVDECGWGSIAGPLVITAAVVPWGFKNPGFKDSKRFTTDNARKQGAEFAKENVLDYDILHIHPDDVAYYGAGKSLAYAQRNLIQILLGWYPDSLIVVDGNKKVNGIPREKQVCITSADACVPVVSAASIIAKDDRDEWMRSEIHPQEWEFFKNKGYPTPEHVSKLKSWGPIQGLHRMNVKLVKDAFYKIGWYEKSRED